MFWVGLACTACRARANSHVHFVVHLCFSFPAERPKLYLSLTPTISIAIGITSALLIGGCAILIGLRLSKCQNHPRHHHHHPHRQSNGQSDAQRSLKITSKPILYNGSPGSSNKSGGGSHKDDDGDGDEKNPDVIPDSSEEQVSSSNGSAEKEVQRFMDGKWMGGRQKKDFETLF